MKHLWSIICRKAIIDSETKNISIIDVLEEIIFHNVGGLPKKEPKIALACDFEIISYWLRDDLDEKTVDFSVEIIDPNNMKVGGTENKMKFPEADKMRMRTIIKSKALPFTTEGRYWFKIKLNGEKSSKTMAEIPVEVKLQEKSEIK
jgi:hypothetical protein